MCRILESKKKKSGAQLLEDTHEDCTDKQQVGYERKLNPFTWSIFSTTSPAYFVEPDSVHNFLRSDLISYFAQ